MWQRLCLRLADRLEKILLSMHENDQGRRILKKTDNTTKFDRLPGGFFPVKPCGDLIHHLIEDRGRALERNPTNCQNPLMVQFECTNPHFKKDSSLCHCVKTRSWFD